MTRRPPSCRLAAWLACASLSGAAAVLGLSPERGATQARETRAERLTRIVQDLRAATRIPGVAVALADGQTPLTVTAGVALLEHPVPVDSSTRFRLASVSKAVTAVALAALVQKDLVDLDRPIGQYLGGLPVPIRVITPRQLAGHLSGIRHYTAADTAPGTNIELRHYPSLRDALPIFVRDPLGSEPGAEYRYSTFAFTLLGVVMEAAADRGFEELIDTELSSPLGLTTLGADVPERIVPGRTGFFERGDADAIQHASYVDSSHKVPGAGLMASAPELAALGLALTDSRLLPARARAALFTTQRTSDARETGVGLAWRIDRDPLQRTVWHHEGSMKGARSALVIYPGEGLAISLLSNLTATPLFAFETAASLVASALAPRTAACPAGTAGPYGGTAVMDGIETQAEGALRAEGGGVRGMLAISEVALPVDRQLPVVDGWCGPDGLTLIVLVGPDFGLVPVRMTPSNGTLTGSTELQGGHRLALSLARR